MPVPEDPEVAEAEPAAYPDRPHLHSSRQLSWDRVPVTPAAHSAVCDLLAQLLAWESRQRARRADDLARLEGTLGAVALDLFVAAGEGPELWLAYSRRNEDYEAAKRRYVHPLATRVAVTKVADFMLAAGFAEGTAGSYRRQDMGGRGYRSRLRGTDRLVRFFSGRGIGLDHIGVREGAELVILKGPAVIRGGQKPLLGYTDTPTTNRMREALNAWAAVANRHHIQPDHARWDPTERPLLDSDGGAGETVERHRARLYRVFNSGSWTAGGRFYGGWWMTMPSAQRRRLTIDSEPVVELDFKGLHPRMAYHLAGRPLGPNEDPYDLGPAWAQVDRGIIKIAFNQLLAVDAEGGIKKPKGVQLPRGLTYTKLLATLEARHAPIRAWLRSAKALELQHLDSQIAAGVLGYFTRSLERPILPVHDSFIVAARDERKLGETMFLAYRAVLKDRSKVAAWPVVKGWTPGAGIEARVLANVGQP